MCKEIPGSSNKYTTLFLGALCAIASINVLRYHRSPLLRSDNSSVSPSLVWTEKLRILESISTFNETLSTV
jgi:hypothetical protein